MRGIRHYSRTGRRAWTRPRTILLWVVVLTVVATVLRALSPWILPIRIIEGPIVQMAAPDAVTLVWYTTRPAECAVTVNVDGESRTTPAVAEGARNSLRISGLSPDSSYTYDIRLGDRDLTEGRAFQTNRGDEQPYTFIVFGDSGRGTRSQYVLARTMNASQPAPEFLLHTGDLVYSGGARRKYNERFFTPYRQMLARINFWPCVGNHELDEHGQSPAYQEVFEVPANGPVGLPEDFNYSFDYATCRVAVIDSNADEETLRTLVAPWLLDVMAQPAPRWKFACLHHPPYSGGKYLPDGRVQRALVPAFEQAGIDIVFSGHDHSYQRSHPLLHGEIVAPGEGIVYVISGAGGAELYEPRGPVPDFVASYDYEDYSFTQVTIDGDALTLRQITLDGELADEITLTKGTPRDDISPP